MDTVSCKTILQPYESIYDVSFDDLIITNAWIFLLSLCVNRSASITPYILTIPYTLKRSKPLSTKNSKLSSDNPFVLKYYSSKDIKKNRTTTSPILLNTLQFEVLLVFIIFYNII